MWRARRDPRPAPSRRGCRARARGAGRLRSPAGARSGGSRRAARPRRARSRRPPGRRAAGRARYSACSSNSSSSLTASQLTGCRRDPPAAGRPSASRRAARRRPDRSTAPRPLAKKRAICSCAASAAAATAAAPAMPQEGVRVLRERRVRREGEVVPEERRRSAQGAGADDRRRRRVRHGLIAARELEDDRLRGMPASGARRCGAYAAGLPACCAHSLFSISAWIGRRARHRVDDRRQIPQRHVLVELERGRAGSRATASARRGRARRAAGTRGTSRAISMIGPPGTFGTPARTFGSTPRRFVAVDAAERLAEVGDPGGVRSAAPSPSTSTPTSISRTSCMRSITVWRRPSRLPTSVCGGTALTPSVESIVPSPFWSIPRPRPGASTGAPA